MHSEAEVLLHEARHFGAVKEELLESKENKGDGKWAGRLRLRTKNV